MSFKAAKIQPVRGGVLAVQSLDSAETTSGLGLSYKLPDDDVFNGSTGPKQKRRRSFAGPIGNQTGNNSSNNSKNGNANNNNSAANPHQKYARTLGNVSEVQSQTTLLSAPPKLKARAKSFSGIEKLDLFDDNSSVGSNNSNNNNSRGALRRPSAGNGGANASHALTLSRANSRSSLPARKKRVTFRNPLIDDRLDSEASMKFSRAYSGMGQGLFGLNSRSNSQSRFMADDDDMSVDSSSSANMNNMGGNAGNGTVTLRGKKRGQRKTPANAGGNGATTRKSSWFAWLNIFRLFSKPSSSGSGNKQQIYVMADQQQQNAADGGSVNHIDNTNNTNKNSNSTNGTSDPKSANSASSSSSNATDNALSTNLSDSVVVLGQNQFANNVKNIAGNNSTAKNSTGTAVVTTAPPTPRSSFFFPWRASSTNITASSSVTASSGSGKLSRSV